tara:strand:- start:568 stop:744 length:177 start_codon:yes stop_codon:yes gene_type:complete
MTVEDRKNKMALPKEYYEAARVKKRLQRIEQRLLCLEKVLSDIAARDEKKVKKKQKSS